MGLVSLCVPEEELQDRALAVARKLASLSQSAVRWTKYALNGWLRTAGPIFDVSGGRETVGLGGPAAGRGRVGPPCGRSGGPRSPVPPTERQKARPTRPGLLQSHSGEVRRCFSPSERRRGGNRRATGPTRFSPGAS